MHTRIPNTFSWKAAAKLLKVGPKVLRKQLIELDIFTKGQPGITALPRTKYIKQNYFIISETTYQTGPRTNWCPTVLVTATGIAFLREELQKLDSDSRKTG